MDSLLYDYDDEFGDYENEAADATAEHLQLEACSICGRTFKPETLVKHMSICEKMLIKKRKPFDSFRQRREGTDLADYLPKNFGLPQHKMQQNQHQQQQQQHDIKISPPKVSTSTPASIRKTDPHKTVSIAHSNNRQILSPKETPSTSYRTTKRSLAPIPDQCPYCERSFCIKAYDRHVEWCKEKSRIANHNTTPTFTAAKERLAARTKYKAPNLKSKRDQNREKYSGMSCGESINSLSDCGSIYDGGGGGGGGGAGGHKSKENSEEREQRERSLSISMASSVTSEGKSGEDNCNETIDYYYYNCDKVDYKECTMSLNSKNVSSKNGHYENLYFNSNNFHKPNKFDDDNDDEAPFFCNETQLIGNGLRRNNLKQQQLQQKINLKSISSLKNNIKTNGSGESHEDGIFNNDTNNNHHYHHQNNNDNNIDLNKSNKKKLQFKKSSLENNKLQKQINKLVLKKSQKNDKKIIKVEDKISPKKNVYMPNLSYDNINNSSINVCNEDLAIKPYVSCVGNLKRKKRKSSNTTVKN